MRDKLKRLTMRFRLVTPPKRWGKKRPDQRGMRKGVETQISHVKALAAICLSDRWVKSFHLKFFAPSPKAQARQPEDVWESLGALIYHPQSRVSFIPASCQSNCALPLLHAPHVVPYA